MKLLLSNLVGGCLVGGCFLLLKFAVELFLIQKIDFFDILAKNEPPDDLFLGQLLHLLPPRCPLHGESLHILGVVEDGHGWGLQLVAIDVHRLDEGVDGEYWEQVGLFLEDH